MKNKGFNKESMYNWLIALVIAIVAVVLSVAAVLLSVYLPSNNMQFASADVSSIQTETIYQYEGSFVTNGNASNLECNAFVKIVDKYPAPISSAELPYYNVMTGTYEANGWDYFAVFNTSVSSAPTYSFTLKSSADGYPRMQFVSGQNEFIYRTGSGSSNATYYSLDDYTVLFYWISNLPIPAVYESVFRGSLTTSTFYSNPVIKDSQFLSFWFNTYSDLGSSNEQTGYMLLGAEILNAKNFAVNDNVFVDYYCECSDMSNNIYGDNYRLSRLYDGNEYRYFLCIRPPADVTSIYVFFSGLTGNNVTTYISSSSNPYTFASFKNNTLSTDFIEGYYDDGYTAGYSAGYDGGYNVGFRAGVDSQINDNNNLTTLVWEVFQLPFRLLFGTYDNNSSSETYGQYVGGLFQFTILGLDVRAFVLGLLSLVVIIGIFKFIMGTFGGLGK